MRLSGKLFMGGLMGSPIFNYFCGGKGMRTEQSMEKEQNHIDEEKLNSFRRHCCDSEVVFADAWSLSTEEHQVSDEELLPGEIKAVTFQVGCYTVRSALRVYTIQDPDWYLAEVGKPVDKEDVEMVRKDLALGKGDEKVVKEKRSIFASWGSSSVFADHIPLWRDKLRITHEISAKYNFNHDMPFTYICRASDPVNGKWFEYIGDIYAVKERDTVPDENASLLIYFVFTSDFYGVDTWYQFDPDGNVRSFSHGPFNTDRR